MFGWLQIEKIIEGSNNILKYLDDVGMQHPHGFGDVSRYSNNTLYIGKKNLTYSNKKLYNKGHGLFKKTHKDLILTEENSTRSKWKLSEKFFSNTHILFLNRL